MNGMSAWSDTESMPSTIVTGAAGGLGRVTTDLLLSRGHRVAVVDRSADAVRSAIAELTDRGHDSTSINGVVADLRCEDGVVSAVDTLLSKWDRIDNVVHNAGVEPQHTAGQWPVDLWENTFAVNVRAAALLVRELAPSWTAGPGGCLVAIGSRTWASGSSTMAYGASKAALIGLARSVASELGPHGVRANVVAPGFVRTPLSRHKGDAHYVDDYASRFAALAPLRRLIEPIDVAESVAFLLSGAARNITGEILNVAAGMHLPPTVR